jgi:hypothetical protein
MFSYFKLQNEMNKQINSSEVQCGELRLVAINPLETAERTHHVTSRHVVFTSKLQSIYYMYVYIYCIYNSQQSICLVLFLPNDTS